MASLLRQVWWLTFGTLTSCLKFRFARILVDPMPSRRGSS
jgi:hypothetical protein